jgi:hypothetical protein
MKDSENRIKMPGSPPLFPLPTPARRGQEQEKRIEEEPGGIKRALRARTRKRAPCVVPCCAPCKRGLVPVGWDT